MPESGGQLEAATGRALAAIGSCLGSVSPRPITMGRMSDYELWTLTWSGIVAVATSLQLLIVVLATAFAYRQVREANRTRRLEGTLALIQHLGGPDLRRARRYTSANSEQLCEFAKQEPSWEDLDDFIRTESHGTASLDSVREYLASFEHVAMLAIHDLAPDEIVNTYFRAMACDHWERLKPFLLFLRRKHGSNDFLQHLEMYIELVSSVRSDRHGRVPGRLKRRMTNERSKVRDSVVVPPDIER